MQTKLRTFFIALVLLSGVHHVAGQTGRFFRISGPSATTIITFSPDGTLIWSNAQAAATYTVQTSLSLPGGTNWVDHVQVLAAHGLNTNWLNTNWLAVLKPPAGMTLIPAGAFQMGNSTGDSDITDAPVHTVSVSSFYMDTNLVSWGQWQAVYFWAVANGYSFATGAGKGANHPVQTVSWYDCVKWCNARSEMEGRIPAYYTDPSQTTVYRTGLVNLDNRSVKWTGDGFRLPTEAEWEKAARGWLNGQRFLWGNIISQSQANYYGSGNSYDLGPNGFNSAYKYGLPPYTSPVGSFSANGYGLNDMAGNVFQWCWDWYDGNYYNNSPGTDPAGPVLGSYRVLRGGAWSFGSYFARSATRGNNFIPGNENSYGLRCVWAGAYTP